nr:MAG: hypothetical protein DIU64_13290 [Caldicoprobacter oshimai]
MIKKRKILLSSIIIAAFVILFFFMINISLKSNINNAFDVTIENGVKWIKLEESKRFKITPKIMLKPSEKVESPYLIFDLYIENKTDKPIYNIVVTAFLSDKIRKYMSTPLNIFGNVKDNPVNLIPGKIPYALYVTKITNIPNYNAFTEEQKEEMMEILKEPIKVKISYDGGVEYLLIDSSEIIIENYVDK